MDEQQKLTLLKDLFISRYDGYGLETPEGVKFKKEPLTDEVLLAHLKGSKRIGTPPFTGKNGAVKWFVFDVDESKESVKAREKLDPESRKKAEGEADLRLRAKTEEIRLALIREGFFPYVERSRRRGYHVWVFFSEPAEAEIVRNAFLKFEVKTSKVNLGVEIFPKQNLPTSTYPGWVFLPLHGRSVKEDRGVFLSEDFAPFEDQWETLSKIKRSKIQNGDGDKASTAKHPDGWQEKILSGVGHGTRNESFAQLAGRLVAKGLSRSEILPVLKDANSKSDPPLTEKEVETILDSIIKTHQKNRPEETAKCKRTYIFTDGEAMKIEKNQEVEWLWDGVFPSGGLGLLLAKPKVGKTIFAFNLAARVSRGEPFLGKPTKKGPVLYLALEENRRMMIKNMNRMDGDFSGIKFHVGMAPEKAFDELIGPVEEMRPVLVVIDILQKFLRLKDIDAYAEATVKLEPLNDLGRRMNTLFLLTHHSPKMERELVDSALGTTGLLAAVDTGILIKKNPVTGRRSFSTIQRYQKDGEEDLSDLILSLQEDGVSLEASGSIKEADLALSKELVMKALSEIGPGKFYTEPMTMTEIREAVQKAKNIVNRCIREMFDEKQINRKGSGKKNDPYRYDLNF